MGLDPARLGPPSRTFRENFPVQQGRCSHTHGSPPLVRFLRRIDNEYSEHEKAGAFRNGPTRESDGDETPNCSSGITSRFDKP